MSAPAELITTPLPQKATQDIKQLFQRLDANGDGKMSREELAVFMQMLGDFSEGEVDKVIAQADVNCNGMIEFEEFIDWINKPTAPVVMGDQGEARRFDVASALRPLFKLYDLDDSGSISKEEFLECHGLLIQSVKEAISGGSVSLLDGAHAVPVSALVAGDVEQVFAIVDANRNGSVELDEFVRWQTQAMLNSGLTKESMVELVQKLANLIQAVMMLWTNKRRQHAIIMQDPSLSSILKKAGMMCLKIWRVPPSSGSVPALRHSSCHWFTMPVDGMKLKELLDLHLAVPLSRPLEVVSVDPMTPLVIAEESSPDNRWLAKLTRRVHLMSHEVTSLDIFYEYADGRWKTLESSDVSRFNQAEKTLPPEFRLLCRLLVQADFGQELHWTQIKSCLAEAVSAYLLSGEDSLRYIKKVEESIHATTQVSLREGMTRRELTADILEQVIFSPLDVMFKLCTLGVMPKHPLW